MKFKYFALLIIIVIAVSNVAFAQSSTKDEAAFKSLIKQMTDAQIAYDAAALDKVLASDYVEISPVGEFDPREKVLGFYTPKANAEAGNMSTSLEVADWSIRSYDKFGVAIVRFNYTLTNDGKPLPLRSMRVTIVFRKEKGDWKIASAQYTGIRASS